MSLQDTIVSQFEQPHGTLGYIAGWVMAHRPSNHERNSWTVDLLDPQAEDRIMEIGCGPGLALKACLARITNGLVVGLDHSQTMLNQAWARNAQAILDGRLQLHLGTLGKLPYADGYFDKIFSVNVVQFIDDKGGVFNVLRTKLRRRAVWPRRICQEARTQAGKRLSPWQMRSRETWKPWDLSGSEAKSLP